MTRPVPTHLYIGVVREGDHAGNERCSVCNLPRANRRHQVGDIDPEWAAAERARYGEREDDQ